MRDDEIPMQNVARIRLLAHVARSASGSEIADGRSVSILSLAAASYGSRPLDDATVPTGFDPIAVALFEAIVEAAYLVANAGGLLDVDERRVFDGVVIAACGGFVSPEQVEELVFDLASRLRTEGVDARVHAIARAITKKEHAHEVLRVASLLAKVTDEISPVERNVLLQLAGRCGLDGSDVEKTLNDVRVGLRAAGSA